MSCCHARPEESLRLPRPMEDHEQARQFATQVVARLREAGHEALWAGGCVRDMLLGHAPKDYDVATDAPPDRVREIFGRRRTLALGASFGVITVLAPRGAGQVEVATFRCDADYSDGRHPDAVTFSTAREDAKRRDFTINGLFFDPLDNRVIDYVDGRRDIAARVIRAIGDPHARLAEDKLRMLRAVRFAATLNFDLDLVTRHAIADHAREISIVAAERIAAEMRRMLAHRNRTRALRLLRETGLLAVVLPEVAADFDRADEEPHRPEASAWSFTLHVLESLGEAAFEPALAAVLRHATGKSGGHKLAEAVAARWRLSKQERAAVGWLLAHEADIARARQLKWSRLQPILIDPRIEWLLKHCAAVAQAAGADTADVDYCRDKLKAPREHLNPPPLITGDDLQEHGVPPGPTYRKLLAAARRAQLDGEIHSKAEALELVDRRLSQ